MMKNRFEVLSILEAAYPVAFPLPSTRLLLPRPRRLLGGSSAGSSERWNVGRGRPDASSVLAG